MYFKCFYNIILKPLKMRNIISTHFFFIIDLFKLQINYYIIVWYRFRLFGISWVDYIRMAILVIPIYKNHVSTLVHMQILLNHLKIIVGAVRSVLYYVGGQLYLRWHCSRWNSYNRWTVASPSALAWSIYKSNNMVFNDCQFFWHVNTICNL